MAMGVRLANALNPSFETQSTCMRQTGHAGRRFSGKTREVRTFSETYPLPLDVYN
jgi:hypothetical protein